MITQARLKELLHYNPVTGLFVRRVSRGSVKAGALAGYTGDKGYTLINIDGRRYKAHRLVFLYMVNCIPDEVDHRNQIKADNGWSNLRASNRTDNARNMPLSVRNTTGVTGVTWRPRQKKWVARITLDGRRVQLGRFDRFSEAATARLQAESKHGFHPNHGKSI